MRVLFLVVYSESGWEFKNWEIWWESKRKFVALEFKQFLRRPRAHAKTPGMSGLTSSSEPLSSPELTSRFHAVAKSKRNLRLKTFINGIILKYEYFKRISYKVGPHWFPVSCRAHFDCYKEVDHLNKFYSHLPSYWIHPPSWTLSARQTM